MAVLKVGYIGDSICTDLAMGAATAELIALGYTATGVNQGASGSSTADWLSGSGRLSAAKAAFAAAGVTLVHVMLGTNDIRTPNSFTPTQHAAYMKNIVLDLTASGYQVVISKPLWTVPGAAFNGVAWPSDVNAAYLAYFTADMALVDGSTVFQGDTANYAASILNNPAGMQSSDGVHPTDAGALIVGRNWAVAIDQRFGRAPVVSLPAGAANAYRGGFVRAAGGSGTPPGGQVTGFALDDISTAAEAGYSFRKLRAGYTGPAIRVARLSDGVEQDIGFDGIDLDVAALAAFSSGTAAVFKRCYDQSGNGRDVVVAPGPNTVYARIFASGAIVAAGPNGRPTFNSMGGDTMLSAASDFTAGSVSVVVGLTGTTAGGANAMPMGGAAAVGSFYPLFMPSANTMSSGFSYPGAGNVPVVNGVETPEFPSGPALASVYVAAHGEAAALSRLDIGQGYAPWAGPISEVLIFPTALSAGDQAALQQGQATYFGSGA